MPIRACLKILVDTPTVPCLGLISAIYAKQDCKLTRKNNNNNNNNNNISSNPIALNPATASLAANPPGAKVGIPGGGHPEAAKVLLPGD